MKRRISSVLLILFIFNIFIAPCFAITLLTEKEALRKIFRHCHKVIPKTKVLTSDQKQQLIKRLGGKFVEHPKAKGARAIINQNKFGFYSGANEKGEEKCVAVILREPGKWGPIKFIVHMDIQGKIKNVVVMSYTETRGRPIARRSFLRQFVGKTSKDGFRLRKDIVAVSGATVSSSAAAFAVKKAIFLYEEIFLKQ